MRIILSIALAGLLSAGIGFSSDAQSRTLPAQYRKSGERMYLKKLQTRLQTIRPRGELALTQPMRSRGNSVGQGTNASRQYRNELNRRIQNAGNHTQPRLYRTAPQRTSAYQRGSYNRNIRLRSRTIANKPAVRSPRAYNRSLTAYAR